MTTATSVVIARFPLLLPVRNSFASYGASDVTRTSDRGHVAEVKNQGHRSGGVPIQVSKEIPLPLSFSTQDPADCSYAALRTIVSRMRCSEWAAGLSLTVTRRRAAMCGFTQDG